MDASSALPATLPTLRLALVLDQQVGLRTQAINLETFARQIPGVDLTVVPVHYTRPAGVLSRLPLLPRSVKGTLNGVAEIRAGLGDARRFDAILWATWAAKSVPDLVAAAPSFLVMDMTPRQMELMGAWYGYSPKRARFFAGYKRRATARIYQRAAGFFPWNDWVADSLRHDWNVPADKIIPVSPGVDTRRFCPDPGRKPIDTALRLLFVGGDFARKGGDLLLRWLRESEMGRAVHADFVTRERVDSLPANATMHHDLANDSPELLALYRRADLFALPTRADCYSLVALEAMACALPVVISALGGIPDIVLDHETGFLIAPDDTDALFDRLDRLCADSALRQRMGHAALARARTHFDAAAGVARIVDTMRRHTSSGRKLS